MDSHPLKLNNAYFVSSHTITNIQIYILSMWIREMGNFCAKGA